MCVVRFHVMAQLPRCVPRFSRPAWNDDGVVTVLVIILLVVSDALLAVVAGVLGRARGRPFWLWALLGFFFPVLAIFVVLVLPRRG
jgi:hypothetical protein